MARISMLVTAAILLVAGSLGLGHAHASERALVGAAEQAFAQGWGMLAAHVGVLPAAGDVLATLAGFPLRFVLGPVGVVLLVVALVPGRARAARDSEVGEVFESTSLGRREAKRIRKEAVSLAKQGHPIESAELCFVSGLLDEAAGYFLQANELVRVAEIRHDQDRFLESAELYAEAGSHESAAVIYARQGEHERAAEAYREAGDYMVAAEMYEEGGKPLEAARCYEKAELPLAAAEAFLACSEWQHAARSLDAVVADQSAAAHRSDEGGRAEFGELVQKCAYAHERAGDLERAVEALVRGELFEPAAELAEKQGDLESAAELFARARNATAAARVLAALGREGEAARVLAEQLRDAGDRVGAAAEYEKAGDLIEAGDLYRSIEHYAEAGHCYRRYGEPAQAAEMFVQAGDRQRAAQCYEAAREFEAAAECFGLLGDASREAEMLELAGAHLRAGEIHQAAGRQEQAVAVYQQVAQDHPDFVEAGARLGMLFRDQGQHGLAAAKLREVLAGRDLDATTVAAHFCLGTVLEVEGSLTEALDLYEKVQAFDYHYDDVARRSERCRSLRDARAESGFVTAGGAGNPGRYEIESTLGRGGMGVVYKARDTVLDRPVAFKILPEALKENPQALKNFLREAKSAAKLNHPNIVTVYDAGEQDGVFYIAMEFVDGNTLKDIVRARGPIGPRSLVHVVSQMSEALAFAHEEKIVHRDIKTANAMWTRDRKAKIMDFGLAKAIEEVRNHTTVVSGTPYYMSPEQTLGRNIDHRTDIYSLGVSVFEMATGTLPFVEGNLPYHHVHTPPPDPRRVRPELPDDIAQLILRCLQKDPNDRYQQVGEILADLRGIHGAVSQGDT